MTFVVEGFNCPVHICKIILDEAILHEGIIMEVVEDMTNLYTTTMRISNPLEIGWVRTTA